MSRLRNASLAFAAWLHVNPVAAIVILVVVVVLTLIFLTAVTAECYGKPFGSCGPGL